MTDFFVCDICLKGFKALFGLIFLQVTYAKIHLPLRCETCLGVHGASEHS